MEGGSFSHKKRFYNMSLPSFYDNLIDNIKMKFI